MLANGFMSFNYGANELIGMNILPWVRHRTQGYYPSVSVDYGKFTMGYLVIYQGGQVLLGSIKLSCLN